MEAGPADYGRIKLPGRFGTDAIDYGVAALYTHDGGWRDDSGFDAKLNAAATSRWRDRPIRVDLAATTLDQDTAGFITGQGAYRSDQLSRQNANPEAYREAHAVRLTGLLQPPTDGAARLDLRPYLRTSRMEFLQHFLIGKPLERNGQESAGLMSTLVGEEDPDRTLAYGTATLDSGDAVVWTVTQVRPGSPASLSPAERAEALRSAHDQASFRDATVYVTQLRSTADVKVNPQLFE